MSDGGCHFAYLAISAFGEGHFDPAVRDSLTMANRHASIGYVRCVSQFAGLGWSGELALDQHPIAKLHQSICIWLTFDLYPVAALDVVVGFGQHRAQIGIVAQYE